MQTKRLIPFVRWGIWRDEFNDLAATTRISETGETNIAV
jgi:hypothetical protein